MKVIVKFDLASQRWIVTLPEYPSNQAWSHHESEARAVAVATELADDMGYEGVEAVTK